MEENRFERLGVFTYSHEEDTHAHSLEDDVPSEVKQARADRVMEVQQHIAPSPVAGQGDAASVPDHVQEVAVVDA